MEFIVHKQETRLLDLEFTGQSRTILELLKEEVLEDDKVETATIIQDHPVLDEPRLVVRTGEGRRPETALKQAASTLREDLDSLDDGLLEEVE